VAVFDGFRALLEGVETWRRPNAVPGIDPGKTDKNPTVAASA